jgi:GTPase
LIVQNEEDAQFLAKNSNEMIFPIFIVSNVTGKGINLLRKFIDTLSASVPLAKILQRREKFPVEFNIITVIQKKSHIIVGGKSTFNYNSRSCRLGNHHQK